MWGSALTALLFDSNKRCTCRRQPVFQLSPCVVVRLVPLIMCVNMFRHRSSQRLWFYIALLTLLHLFLQPIPFPYYAPSDHAIRRIITLDFSDTELSCFLYFIPLLGLHLHTLSPFPLEVNNTSCSISTHPFSCLLASKLLNSRQINSSFLRFALFSLRHCHLSYPMRQMASLSYAIMQFRLRILLWSYRPVHIFCTFHDSCTVHSIVLTFPHSLLGSASFECGIHTDTYTITSTQSCSELLPYRTTCIRND